MTEAEFWESTPKTFYFRLEGYTESEERREKSEWYRIRWQTAWLLQPHLTKGRRIKPTDLIKFEWEKNKKVDSLTKDDNERLKKFQKKVEKVKKWTKI